jgi:hypothetical protein
VIFADIDVRGRPESPLKIKGVFRDRCYAELYLGVSSSGLRTTRRCTSVVLVPGVEGEGLSASRCD